MKSKIAMAILVAVTVLTVLGLGAACGKTTTTPTTPSSNSGPGAIEGNVTHADGNSVSGMTVFIVDGTAPFPEIAAITDRRGHYSLPTIPDGEFDVAVNDTGGNRLALKTIVVRNGETRELDFVVLSDSTMLSGVVWVLEEYWLLGATHHLLDVLDGTRITVEFETNDIGVTGSTGCNTYIGTVVVDGRTLRMGPLEWTERSCALPEGIMEQEAAFLRALQGSVAYELQDGLLVLADSGEAVLIFRSSGEGR